MKIKKPRGVFSARTHNNVDLMVRKNPYARSDDVMAMESFAEEFEERFDPEKAKMQAKRNAARRLIRNARDKQGIREHMDWKDENGTMRFACTVEIDDMEILERQAENVEKRIQAETRKLEKIHVQKKHLEEKMRQELELMKDIKVGEVVERIPPEGRE